MEDDINLFLADEKADAPVAPRYDPWKVMVVDDDHGVHELTSMVLRRFRFEDRELEVISGYSGAEARVLMQEHPDTAIMLLDVVMESEQAGLDVVNYVRDALKNNKVRIILRTGQPGVIPELEVITRYDINDYRDKSELTRDKLITAIVSALRAYRDLDRIDKNNSGLEMVLEATGELFGTFSEHKLALEVLRRLDVILGYNDLAASDRVSGFAASSRRGAWEIDAGTGVFARCVGQEVSKSVQNDVWAMVERVLTSQRPCIEEGRYGFLYAGNGREGKIFFFQRTMPFSELDLRLLNIYLTNVHLAFRNSQLHREVLAAQKDMTITLGEIIEARSSEFGNHVRRVAECSRLLGGLLGLEEEELEWLYMAAVLLDLGKVVMNDGVFFGSETPIGDKLEQIRQHTVAGFNMLKVSSRRPMQIGATVAHQHHERWDGKGYPQGLRGQEIHLFARIVGLVDCFDALTHHRVYRPAWSREEALEFIRKSRGTQFEPELVDLFFANLEELFAIQDRIPDQEAVMVS
ncbi:MAG: DUF3369 domain-containing protein [Magnetococcales bacterium]|nr:DUF3369 domain-containing protein [Magnetococcales bacterium]